MGITHLGADYAARNLSPVGVSPRNAAYANVRSKPDEAPSRKVIQIELQAVFKAGPVSRTRHRCTRLTFVGATLPLTGYRNCPSLQHDFSAVVTMAASQSEAEETATVQYRRDGPKGRHSGLADLRLQKEVCIGLYHRVYRYM